MTKKQKERAAGKAGKVEKMTRFTTFTSKRPLNIDELRELIGVMEQQETTDKMVSTSVRERGQKRRKPQQEICLLTDFRNSIII